MCKVQARNGRYLLDNIDRRISSGKMPVIVCEGTANRKRARIQANDYLRNCYERLGNMKGRIFIFGSDVLEQDAHIWSEIDKNENLTRVYVGYYGEAKKNGITEKVSKLFPCKVRAGRIALYNSRSINVWNA